MTNWSIEIQAPFGGFAPSFWKTTYPSYGNKNQAGDLQNVNLIDPTFITQGPGLANLTNGTQAGAVTTLLKGILDYAVASDVTYGVGGAKLYKLSSTTVASDANWPHTIDKATVTGEDGEDVAYFQGALYYSYNHSGNAGDIGKYDLSTTFDNDWASTVPTGKTALQGTYPHQMIVGGNDFLYIANKNYITSYDGTTFTEKDLDLPDNCVISSIAWTSNRLWVAANQPNLSGSNKNIASIYVWDGNSSSWEDEIRVMGRIGALKVKNGIVFVFYEDISSTGGYKLGYVSGTSITDVAYFTGSLPLYYQITEYENFLIWVSGGEIWAWGSTEKNMPAILFQLADGGYSTVGGLVAPFGTPIVSSYESTSYRLAKFSGYDTACYWYSLLFDVTASDKKSLIDKVKFNFESMGTGARCDIVLKNNKGASLWTGIISRTLDTTATTKDFFPKCEAENFRCELSWTNSSTSNLVSIKNIKIYGHTIQ